MELPRLLVIMTFRTPGGQITVGLVTATDLIIGTALTTSSNQIGVGTGTPRTLLDVQGVLRTTALSENVDDLGITGTSPNRKVILGSRTI